ncbi:MAG: HEAT repeat domain-containing protein [Thermodesulfobacteriota bacterium]
MDRELSDSLSVLWRKDGWFRRRPASEKVSALHTIARLGGPGQARTAFEFVFHREPEVANQAAQTVRTLMEKASHDDWRRLYGFFCFQHIDLDPKKVRALSRFEAPVAVHLLGVATLNGNGFVREAALRLLGDLGDPVTIPYVMLRLADWVAQVRNVAKQLLPCLLETLTVSDMLRYRALVDGLARIERVDVSDLHGQILSRLRHPTLRPELLRLLGEASPEARLFLWQGIEDEIRAGSDLIDRAIADPHVPIRMWIARTMPLGEAHLHRTVSLLKDKAYRVSLAVLDRMGDSVPEALHGIVCEMLFHKSRQIREMSRFLLRGEVEDFASVYRARLAESPPSETGTVAGLCETGDASDVETIERLVEHPLSRIRAISIAGLHALGSERSREYAIAGLKSPSSRVRRASVSLLGAVLDYDRRPELREILSNGSPEAQLAALRVLAQYRGLDVLEDLLTALAGCDEKVTGTAWKHLIAWHAKYSTRPWLKMPEETGTRIRELVSHHRAHGMPVPQSAATAWHDLPLLLDALELSRLQ